MTSEDYSGSISLFAGNYAPTGYFLCDGSTKSIADFTALYSVISGFYGGDGRNTFMVPDFRGRSFMGFGHAPDLSSRTIGERAGTETQTITIKTENLPPHTHTTNLDATSLNAAVSSTAQLTDIPITVILKCDSSSGARGPFQGYPGNSGTAMPWSTTTDSEMAPNLLRNTALTGANFQTIFMNDAQTSGQEVAVQEVGGGQSMISSNMTPFTVLNYVINHDGLPLPRS
ncbi:MAG: tail fiber protein [bacterium]|nr:tail fiber protein [bacterium]